MSWGRLKPFWQSKAWERSKAKGTGIFSWGDSDYLKLIPGVGGTLDNLADQLGETAKTNKSVFDGPAPVIVSGQEQQGMLILGGLVLAYFIFK